MTDSVKARAADRAIMKVAPFHRQRNGIDDAILIEIYIDALAGSRVISNPGMSLSGAVFGVGDWDDQ